jgi:hypothetical protein
MDKRLQRKQATDDEKQRAENVGILMSSGFIAGESLMAVVLALLFIGAEKLPWLLGFQNLAGGMEPNFFLGLIAFPAVLFGLAWFTVSKMREPQAAPASRID